MPKLRARIAVIGGSGLYAIDRLSRPRELRLKTPFGPHSGPVVLGSLAGMDVAFLPRHGRGHVYLPGEIPSHANIWVLKSLGVERVVAFGAVGSLKEELAPRHFVFPDQLVDETKGRRQTFFGDGVVAHVAFAQPFCERQSGLLVEESRRVQITSHRGGTYAVMEGPLFSSLAESELHRKLGYSLIGMTALPEAKLAREAELCYSAVSLVTDYDCWKPGEEVSTQKVVGNLAANVANARRLIEAALPRLAELPRDCECGRALEGAVFTAPEAMNKKTAARLKLLIGRHLRQ